MKKSIKKLLFVFVLAGILLSANFVFGATLYEYLNTGDDTRTYSFPPYHRAQTFTPQIDHRVTSVELKLGRIGLPDTATISIRATSGGAPTGSDLCSGEINGDTLTTSVTGLWYKISLGSGCDLVADVKYAIVIITPNGDSSNKIAWRADSTSPPYTRGSSWEGTGAGGWNEASGIDQMFEEYAPLIALPTGILASTTAHITEVFNDVKAPIFLGAGIPLAFWVIRKLLLLLPR